MERGGRVIIRVGGVEEGKGEGETESKPKEGGEEMGVEKKVGVEETGE